MDDTLAGLQALRFAVAEARERGVVLRAIRAWEFNPSWYGPDASPRQAELVDAAAMTMVTAFREAMGGAPKDIVVEALVIEGAPAVVLADQARSDRDLLVLGRSRRRRFGSSRVDARCARTAACPVVVVAAPILARDGGAGVLGRDVVNAAEAVLRDAAASHPHHG